MNSFPEPRALAEELVRRGVFAGVLDWTTSEVTDELAGGICTAGPKRLEAATDEALAELSSEDRYVLAAYDLDGRTLAEIARVLGLHESSISRRLDRVTTTLRKRILACLRERGMSHAQAKEALETDVRDVQLDLRARLAQDSGRKAFPGGKVPAPGAGTDGTHV